MLVRAFVEVCPTYVQSVWQKVCQTGVTNVHVCPTVLPNVCPNTRSTYAQPYDTTVVPINKLTSALLEHNKYKPNA